VRENKIIAVDFDGTLCKHEFPEIGAPNINLINWIKERQEGGDEIILWTCRSNKSLKRAIEWCTKQGLKLSAVNEDVESIQDSRFGKSKSNKIYADIYIDDRNFDLDAFNLKGGFK